MLQQDIFGQKVVFWRVGGRGGGVVRALASRKLMTTQTLVHEISGRGTPLARQGRDMGIPSIVLNT